MKNKVGGVLSRNALVDEKMCMYIIDRMVFFVLVEWYSTTPQKDRDRGPAVSELDLLGSGYVGGLDMSGSGYVRVRICWGLDMSGSGYVGGSGYVRVRICCGPYLRGSGYRGSIVFDQSSAIATLSVESNILSESSFYKNLEMLEKHFELRLNITTLRC